ncbi:hypothetical protein DFP72DRAFT_744002, partial [Ephemerocybe angulata]
MLDIATTHHETLQEKYEHTLSPSARGKAREKALSHLSPRLNNRERTRMGRKIRAREVREAAMSIANGKASGLDGIPSELWKFLIKVHEDSDQESENPQAPDIINIITLVLNDIAEHGVAENTKFAE